MSDPLENNEPTKQEAAKNTMNHLSSSNNNTPNIATPNKDESGKMLEKAFSFSPNNKPLLNNDINTSPTQMDYKTFQNHIMLFKDEILKDFKKMETKLSAKYENYTSALEVKLEEYDAKFEAMTQKLAALSNMISTDKSIKEKVEQLFLWKTKTDDVIFNSNVKAAGIEKDLRDAITKYDKIVVDNILYPGIIGQNSKFKSFHDFIDFTIKSCTEVLNYKDKNTIDLKNYKQKLENMLDSFKTQMDNLMITTSDFTLKSIKECEERFASVYKIYDEKLMSMRIENGKFALDLEKETDRLRKEWQIVLQIKKEIFDRFDNEVDDIKKANNLTSIRFENYQKEFKVIKQKFTNLSEFIKDVRFKINLGQTLKRKEMLDMSKDIDFTKKQKLIIDKRKEADKYQSFVNGVAKSKRAESFLKRYIEGEVGANDVFKLKNSIVNQVEEEADLGGTISHRNSTIHKRTTSGKGTPNLNGSVEYTRTIKKEEHKRTANEDDEGINMIKESKYNKINTNLNKENTSDNNKDDDENFEFLNQRFESKAKYLKNEDIKKNIREDIIVNKKKFEEDNDTDEVVLKGKGSNFGTNIKEENIKSDEMKKKFPTSFSNRLNGEGSSIEITRISPLKKVMKISAPSSQSAQNNPNLTSKVVSINNNSVMPSLNNKYTKEQILSKSQTNFNKKMNNTSTPLKTNYKTLDNQLNKLSASQYDDRSDSKRNRKDLESAKIINNNNLQNYYNMNIINNYQTNPRNLKALGYNGPDRNPLHYRKINQNLVSKSSQKIYQKLNRYDINFPPEDENRKIESLMNQIKNILPQQNSHLKFRSNRKTNDGKALFKMNKINLSVEDMNENQYYRLMVEDDMKHK